MLDVGGDHTPAADARGVDQPDLVAAMLEQGVDRIPGGSGHR